MELSRCSDADDFLGRAGDFLAAREAEHNLILGLSGRLQADPHVYGGEDPYFALVEEGRQVVAATMRTPPHNLILSEVDDEGALALIAADVHSRFTELPGVLAPTVAAERFAELWEAETGARGRRMLSQRAFRADSVTLPEGVPGGMRDYEKRDRELVLQWLDAFSAEALPGGSPESSEHALEHRRSDPDGGFAFWEDAGQPVTLAGYGGATPNGIRVGPIYTPPELRRRGYASALTAILTQRLLERRRFCFLFTDLANPTSNRIYQAIGYRPVTDLDVWKFDLLTRSR